MNIQHLIKMANQIGTFFEAMPNHKQASEDIALHIQRFWEPRMRQAILRCIEEHQDGNLRPSVREALINHQHHLLK